MADETAVLDPQPVTDARQPHSLNPAPQYSQLTLSEIARALEWHDRDVPQTEIAERLGKHQSTISRLIAKLGYDSTPIAKRHLAARAYRSAIRLTRIAEKGADDDAIKAAKIVLAANGVSERVMVTANVGVQVMVAPGIEAERTETVPK